MKRLFCTIAALCISYITPLAADSYTDCCYSTSPRFVDACCEDTCYPDMCCPDACCPDWSVEFRIGAYIPTNTKKCDRYTKVWADYQLQIGKRFMNNWQAFVEFDAARVNGNRHEHGFDTFGFGYHARHKEHFWVMPLSFGIKYFFNLCENFDAYIGGGAAYTWLTRDENNHYHSDLFGDDHHKHNDTKSGWGGVIKSGVIYTFCNSWFLDIFVDYLFQKIDVQRSHYEPLLSTDPFPYHHHKHTIDVSGFKVGGGIGYNF